MLVKFRTEIALWLAVRRGVLLLCQKVKAFLLNVVQETLTVTDDLLRQCRAFEHLFFRFFSGLSARFGLGLFGEWRSIDVTEASGGDFKTKFSVDLVLSVHFLAPLSDYCFNCYLIKSLTN